MDDLIPFLIFIVIALINLVKTFLEKSAEKKAPTRPEGEAPVPPKRQPSSIEEFFEQISEKLEPKPRPSRVPEWPTEFERPDYLREMEEFTTAERTEPVQQAPEQPVPPPVPWASEPEEQPMPVVAPFVTKRPMAVFTPHALAPRSHLIGTSGMRIDTPPLLRSAAGLNEYNLKGRKALRKAVIANLIFSPPRAYETSFENTIIK